MTWQESYKREFRKHYEGILSEEIIEKSLQWNLEFIGTYISRAMDEKPKGKMSTENEVEELAKNINDFSIEEISWEQCQTLASKLIKEGYFKSPANGLVPFPEYEREYTKGYIEGFNKCLESEIKKKSLENNPILFVAIPLDGKKVNVEE